MMGYGPEDNHFVVELTYNYNVDKYEQGNDFRAITIRSREAINRAKAAGWPIKDENGLSAVQAPGGYKFLLIDEPQPVDKGKVRIYLNSKVMPYLICIYIICCSLSSIRLGAYIFNSIASLLLSDFRLNNFVTQCRLFM